MNIEKKTRLISESDYIRKTLVDRYNEAVWQTNFTGKDHMVIPDTDFSVTLCGRTVIEKDYYDLDESDGRKESDKCKQCLEALMINTIGGDP